MLLLSSQGKKYLFYYLNRILELAAGSIRLKSLRVVRVFRPLKSINVIPSMRKLIFALI